MKVQVFLRFRMWMEVWLRALGRVQGLTYQARPLYQQRRTLAVSYLAVVEDIQALDAVVSTAVVLRGGCGGRRVCDTDIDGGCIIFLGGRNLTRGE